MNITDYNLAKDFPNEIPNYDPDPSNRAMYYILDNSENVIIMAEHDNNYHYWVSRTSVFDLDINDAILRHITECTDDKMLGKWDDFGRPELSWGVLYRKYKRFFRLNNEFNLTAADIKADYCAVKDKCRALEADRDYYDLLKDSLKTLSLRTKDPVKDYYNAKKLIKEMESYDYLICADNDEYRNLYSQIQEQCGDLYGGAMSIMR